MTAAEVTETSPPLGSGRCDCCGCEGPVTVRHVETHEKTMSEFVFCSRGCYRHWLARMAGLPDIGIRQEHHS